MNSYWDARSPPAALPVQPFTGEFPPELVDIIGKFSRPRLRFISEFKAAMAELGLRDWPELKEKLSTNDAEHVKVFLDAYLAARRLEIEAKNAYMSGGSNVRWAKAYSTNLKAYAALTTLL